LRDDEDGAGCDASDSEGENELSSRVLAAESAQEKQEVPLHVDQGRGQVTLSVDVDEDTVDFVVDRGQSIATPLTSPRVAPAGRPGLESPPAASDHSSSESLSGMPSAATTPTGGFESGGSFSDIGATSNSSGDPWEHDPAMLRRSLDVSYYKNLGHIRDAQSFRMPCAMVKKTGIHPGVLHVMRDSNMVVWAPVTFVRPAATSSDVASGRRTSRAPRDDRVEGYKLATDTAASHGNIVKAADPRVAKAFEGIISHEEVSAFQLRRPRLIRMVHVRGVLLRHWRLQDTAIEIVLAPEGGPRTKSYFLAFPEGV